MLRLQVPLNFDFQKPVIDPNDAAMLLIDHQSGFFQTIGDMPTPKLRSHAAALAKMASLLMESYAKAQEVEKQHEQLDSQRAA